MAMHPMAFVMFCPRLRAFTTGHLGNMTHGMFFFFFFNMVTKSLISMNQIKSEQSFFIFFERGPV